MAKSEPVAETIELPSLSDLVKEINAEPQDTDDRPRDGRTRSGTMRGQRIERETVERVYNAIKALLEQDQPQSGGELQAGQQVRRKTVIWGN
jgi:hypothetical protein